MALSSCSATRGLQSKDAPLHQAKTGNRDSINSLSDSARANDVKVQQPATGRQQRHQRKAARIEGRTAVRLEKQRTQQQKEQNRTQTGLKKAETEQKRTESGALVKLSQQETTRNKRDNAVLLARAEAEKKHAAAELARARAANVRLGLQIAGGLLLGVVLFGLFRRFA